MNVFAVSFRYRKMKLKISEKIKRKHEKTNWKKNLYRAQLILIIKCMCMFGVWVVGCGWRTFLELSKNELRKISVRYIPKGA